VSLADFGCSEGKNSVAALSAAAAAALGAGAPAVHIAHVDLPDNNWAAVQAAVDAGYEKSEKLSVSLAPFPKGFYQACFPPASLDVTYASAAFHWASGEGLPLALPDAAVTPKRTTDAAAREAALAAAAADWEKVLTLRAQELRPGGKLVMSNVVDDGPLDGVWKIVEREWAALHASGAVSDAECAAAVVRVHQRSAAQWMAPLRDGGGAAGLFRVVDATTVTQVAPAYAALKAGTGDAAAYGLWVSRFFEAVTRPVFEAAVAGKGEGEARRVVDGFFAAIAAGVAAESPPPPFEMGNLVMVLERV
jgi:hypothetical protein